jgi:hypothetical protein
MWLALISAAWSQVQLVPSDHGATLALGSVVVDLADPALDLDRVSVQAPTRTLTVGALYDEVLAAGAVPDELLVVSTNGVGALRASFQHQTPRVCRPMHEYRCIPFRGCGWVEVGIECCSGGAGPAGPLRCDDHIYAPGMDP